MPGKVCRWVQECTSAGEGEGRGRAPQGGSEAATPAAGAARRSAASRIRRTVSRPKPHAQKSQKLQTHAQIWLRICSRTSDSARTAKTVKARGMWRHIICFSFTPSVNCQDLGLGFAHRQGPRPARTLPPTPRLRAEGNPSARLVCTAGYSPGSVARA